jgi:hypothetical protein
MAFKDYMALCKNYIFTKVTTIPYGTITVWYGTGTVRSGTGTVRYRYGMVP